MMPSAARSSKSESSTTRASGALAVEQAQQPVHLVGDLRQALGELVVVDLEDRLERRQLLEHAAPLVQAAHALHEQALGGDLDALGPIHRDELHLELALEGVEHPVEGVLALEPAQLRVDDLPSWK